MSVVVLDLPRLLDESSAGRKIGTRNEAIRGAGLATTSAPTTRTTSGITTDTRSTIQATESQFGPAA